MLVEHAPLQLMPIPTQTGVLTSAVAAKTAAGISVWCLCYHCTQIVFQEFPILHGFHILVVTIYMLKQRGVRAEVIFLNFYFMLLFSLIDHNDESHLLVNFTGHLHHLHPWHHHRLLINGPKTTIRFTTDASNTMTGFEMEYEVFKGDVTTLLPVSPIKVIITC